MYAHKCNTNKCLMRFVSSSQPTEDETAVLHCTIHLCNVTLQYAVIRVSARSATFKSYYSKICIRA
jgi:hypothetical protein